MNKTQNSLSDLAKLFGSDKIQWNLHPESLIEHASINKEGSLTNTGALMCATGKFTGRSPLDRVDIISGDPRPNYKYGLKN